MVIWKKPADPATAVDRCFLEYGKAEDHPYAYSYRKADGAEFALARLHRETGIGELEIVNAIRNLMRAHPAYEQFLLTEGARVKKGTDLFVKKLCRLRYNSRHRRVS